MAKYATTQPLDPLCKVLVEGCPNLAVPWFLGTSYLYYRLEVSIITDECFDWLAKFMLEHWDAIDHRHKVFVSHEDLKAGTGYAIPWEDVPERVKGGASAMYDAYLHGPPKRAP